MATPTVTVEVGFPTSPSLPGLFVLDDTTKGVLDSATYKLGGDTTSVDITSTVTAVHIRRGRTRSLDRFEPGTATITVRDTDGTWNPQNPSSPYYPNVQVRRPVRITAALNGVGYNLFTGLVQSYRYSYEKSNRVAYVTLECADLLSQLSQLTVTTITGATAGETTGARISKILDMASTLSSAARQIDTGLTVLQADPATSRTLQTAVQDVVDSELGAFFVKADGTLRYVDRSGVIKGSNYNPTVFADDGTGIAYLDLNLAFDDTLLANQVTVTPNGLAAQTANNTTSQSSFGLRTLARTSWASTTGDAANQATYLANGRGTPALRCDAILLDTWSGDTQALQALTRDFLDAVTVKHSHTGTASTFNVFVQGVEHDITPGSWQTVLRLAETFTGFVLDTSRLDTGVLTY